MIHPMSKKIGEVRVYYSGGSINFQIHPDCYQNILGWITKDNIYSDFLQVKDLIGNEIVLFNPTEIIGVTLVTPEAHLLAEKLREEEMNLEKEKHMKMMRDIKEEVAREFPVDLPLDTPLPIH